MVTFNEGREHARRRDAAGAAELPPCANPACRTTGGAVQSGASRPARTDGTKYGMPGLLCLRCYSRAYDRAKRQTSARPCTLCGTTSGFVRGGPGVVLPVRYDGARFGLPAGSVVCHACASSSPEYVAIAFGRGCGPVAAEGPAPSEAAMRREAAAIRTAQHAAAIVAGGVAAARLAAMREGPRPAPPPDLAEEARRALRDYALAWATIGGLLAAGSLAAGMTTTIPPSERSVTP